MDERDYPKVLWRTGRTVGRTIYAMRSDVPSDTDPLIGLMDTPATASEAVSAHNALLEQERA
jgi:hypothetical protein